jgi:hypothetical protein
LPDAGLDPSARATRYHVRRDPFAFVLKFLTREILSIRPPIEKAACRRVAMSMPHDVRLFQR